MIDVVELVDEYTRLGNSLFTSALPHETMTDDEIRFLGYAISFLRECSTGLARMQLAQDADIHPNLGRRVHANMALHNFHVMSARHRRLDGVAWN